MPRINRTNAIDEILWGFEIQRFIQDMRRKRAAGGRPSWELRLGIHSGSLIAGVVGRQEFLYDVWGDTVNTASRLESSGEPDQINISEATCAPVQDCFDCVFREKSRPGTRMRSRFASSADSSLNTLKTKRGASSQKYREVFEELSRFLQVTQPGARSDRAFGSQPRRRRTSAWRSVDEPAAERVA